MTRYTESYRNLTLVGFGRSLVYQVTEKYDKIFRIRKVGDMIIIIIIIINDNVYGAVIVTMVTARVHPVHLMNAD